MSDTLYAVKSGFFDAINRDRLYSADDMNQPYKEILTEGIDAGGFEVTPQGTPNMTVNAAAGHAFLGGKWVDAAAKTLTVPENTTLYGRIDAVVLRVDINSDVRAANLIYRTGTPADTPEAPALIETTGIYEVRLANIAVAASATAIAAAQITDKRGGTDCPYADIKLGQLVREQQIADEVSSWLTEHVDPVGSAVVVDNSLSIAGAAADAKTTGDALADLNEEVFSDELYYLLNKSSADFTVEDGYYAAASGKVALSGYRLCYMTASKDFDFYCDPADAIPAGGVLFIAVYNGTISAETFVRQYRTTNNNIPDINNKATIEKNQVIALSIYTPNTDPHDFALYANYKYTVMPSKFKNFAYAKKVAWFGDSISQLKQFPHLTGLNLDMTVYDCSVKGSCVGRTYSNFNSFSFSQLVTAIINGNFAMQYAELAAQEQATGQDLSDIRENLNTLSTIDFSNIDYIVMLYGTNDFAIPITPASGYDSRLAETQALMDDAIHRFLAFKPHLKFYIISPFYRGDGLVVDQQNHTLNDYVEMENTVAIKYAIPFLNLMKNSRICADTEIVYLNSVDHVHPTDAGDLYLAELASKFIATH